MNIFILALSNVILAFIVTYVCRRTNGELICSQTSVEPPTFFAFTKYDVTNQIRVNSISFIGEIRKNERKRSKQHWPFELLLIVDGQQILFIGDNDQLEHLKSVIQEYINACNPQLF